MTKVSNQRIEYIDFFRGIGIIFMVMCHVGINSRVSHLIYGFHMPLFFFVSGWFFRSDKYSNWWQCIKRNLKTLILPYAFFCFIQYLFWVILEADSFSIVPYLQCFYMNTDSALYFGKACWFLTAMFWVQVGYDFLHRHIKNQYVIDGTVAVLGAGGVLGHYLIDLPLAIWPACVGLVFYHIAVRIKKNSKLQNNVMSLPLWGSILICIVACAIIMLNGDVNMKKSIYSNPILFLVGAVLAILAGLNLSRHICQWRVRDYKIFDVIIRAVCFIGCNSITYLGLNEMFIKYINVTLGYVGLPGIVARYLNIILTLICCTLFDIIIRRSKLKVLIGK